MNCKFFFRKQYSQGKKSSSFPRGGFIVVKKCQIKQLFVNVQIVQIVLIRSTKEFSQKSYSFYRYIIYMNRKFFTRKNTLEERKAVHFFENLRFYCCQKLLTNNLKLTRQKSFKLLQSFTVYPKNFRYIYFRFYADRYCWKKQIQNAKQNFREKKSSLFFKRFYFSQKLQTNNLRYKSFLLFLQNLPNNFSNKLSKRLLGKCISKKIPAKHQHLTGSQGEQNQTQCVFQQ
eukprot:TRINITY_DN6779_c2_g1_i1.p2 TRINITY_DN6779_c2_g1~~TRINITY_DN6779_c2_g1_i1.p2  ORF type:complete len:230 (+),score=7.84 TRINITY_DN6779_c2_g1_i1:673-1362(+)